MLRSRALIGVAAVAIGLTACGPSSASTGGQLAISTYGTGTSTYADTAAVASAMTNRDGTKIRIITSDTGIGRMTPLRQGTAQFTRTGAEYIYAFEGDNEFATKEWGPQSIRVVWAPTAPASFAVLEDSGIVEPADLAGKRVPTFTANASATNKMDAILAGAGLTRGDVETVEVDYGAQAEALEAGKVDVVYMSVGAPALFELDGSSGISWLRLDPADERLAAALAERAPDVWIDEFTHGAGQAEGQRDNGLSFVVPVVTTTDTPGDTVRQLITGVTASFDDYKGATSTTPLWGMDEAKLSPVLVPFHDELVAFLENAGRWTDEAQKEQDRLLAREEKLRGGWAEVSAGTSDDELATAWAAWKGANLVD